MFRAAFASCLCIGFLSFAAEPSANIDVWKGKPPGETKELPPEGNMTKPKDGRPAGKAVIRIGNVSTPSLAVYKPKKELDQGVGVVICPGGGFNILAYDLEGTEVAEWLNSKGITAYVLKYRVPARDPKVRWTAAVQDAQRSLSLVKSMAKEQGLNKVGILGFSAGGEAAGRAALMERQYPAADDIDKVSCKPDFAVLVYPAYMADAKTGQLKEDLQVTKDSPAMFFAHASDDPVTAETSVLLYLALKRAKVPAELHVFTDGGHGYGLRKTEKAVTGWPELCEGWFKTMKMVK